jgi:hypothetical protein
MKALGPFKVSAVSGGRTGLGLGIIIGTCEVMSVSDEMMSSSRRMMAWPVLTRRDCHSDWDRWMWLRSGVIW